MLVGLHRSVYDEPARAAVAQCLRDLATPPAELDGGGGTNARVNREVPSCDFGRHLRRDIERAREGELRRAGAPCDLRSTCED